MRKKIAITSLLAVMLLSFVASTAFAAQASEPDSSSNPNRFYTVNDWFDGTIPSYSDTDYFSWTNDTGSVKTYFVYLLNLDDPNLDYQIKSIGISGWPPGSSSLYFDQVGRECWAVTVPAGGELRVTVGAQNVNMVHPTSTYEISLKSVPPAP